MIEAIEAAGDFIDGRKRGDVDRGIVWKPAQEELPARRALVGKG